jgi:hypothetical protein
MKEVRQGVSNTNFYDKLLNELQSQDLNACITCDKFEGCDKMLNYLGHCDNYSWYMEQKQSPVPLRNIHIDVNLQNRSIKIECVTKGAVYFITGCIGVYGKLYKDTIGFEIGREVKYYTLHVSNLYNLKKVAAYIDSYNM